MRPFDTIPAYSRDPAPEWCARFVGIPYELAARQPDLLDCWGLCWKVLIDQFKVDAPSYEGVVWSTKDKGLKRAATGEQIEAFAAADYIPIAPGWEAPGDIILLRIAGHPLHCGIVAAQGWMLHSAEGSDSALERYDEMFWRNRVSGFYRLRALTA